MGCDDSISLTILDSSGQALGSFHGTVEVGGESIEFQCENSSGSSSGHDYNCFPNGALIVYHVASSATLSVYSDSATEGFRGSVTLDITKNRPNGENCDPECTFGTAEVRLEAGVVEP